MARTTQTLKSRNALATVAAAAGLLGLVQGEGLDKEIADLFLFPSERTDRSGRYHSAWTEGHHDIGDVMQRTEGEKAHT